MTDSNPSSSDEGLEKLLRRVSETPSVLDLRRPLRPGDRLAAGRIRVLEELGKGGMGQVFAAYDEEKAARVALKVIGRVTPQAIIHLKREFRIASELVHPHIVRLHELFRDGTEWFFTMDLVHGAPLPELLARMTGAARVELTRNVVLQLADALHAVHQFGSVHGDLKPANFLVDDTTSPPKVLLLDFGLARPIGNGEGGGTLGYMAPEQILGDAVAESADWYSLGVVLHEALSGEIPRAGALSTALESAPPDLAALCRALLSRRPQDRPTGPQVLKILGVPLPGDSSRQSMPSGVRLVGRHAELTQLREFRASAPAPSTSVVLVHGPSGIGKTALLEHFVQIERTRGSIVLRGRCRENESIGYKAVDGVVDDLVGVLSEMTDTEATSILPRSLSELVQLFPALRGSNVIAQAVMDDLERGDQTLIRQRAIGGFAELLRNLAAFGPLVVWIDDLQWSDEESALILGPMLGGADPVPLFFIGSYRSESANHVPVIAALYADDTLSLARPHEVAVGPLSPESAEAMALAILPGDMPHLAAKARDIGQNAAGLPLFIAELAHSWRTTPEATLGDAPVSLSSVVGQRVAGLSPAVQALLELVAIAGGPISRAALKQARRLRSTELDDAVDILRASRLIVTRGLREEHTVDIRHDRLRELVSRDIVDTKRRQHHLSLAVVLDSSGGKPEEVATHYQGAGDVARAGKYWLAAADDAGNALGFRKAAEFYGRALDQAGLDDAERYRVQLRRAQMLAYSGESQLAAELYLFVATSRARDEATELRRLAAEQLLLSGHISQGMRLIDEVLTATRLPRTRGGRAALPSVAIGRMRLRLRGLRFKLRSEIELSREELSRLDVSWTIASSMGFVDFIRGADFQNKHLLLALKAGEPRRLVRALALEALNSAAPTRGSQRRTDQLLQVAESLVDKTPDRDTALGLLSLARGVSAYLHSDTEQAVVHCTAAVETLTERCAGAVWERVTAQRFLIAALFFSGQFARLSEAVPPLLVEAEGTAHLYAKQFFRGGYSIASWLIRDEVAEARRQLGKAEDEWRSETYQLPEYNRLLSGTYIDLYDEKAERAAETIERHWPNVEEAQLLRIAIVRVQMWQLRGATAVAAALAATERGELARAERFRVDARKSVAVLGRDLLRRAKPLAALIEAAADVAVGARDDAETKLREAAANFEALGMQLFAAAARLRLGELVGGEPGQALAERSRDQFQKQRVVDPDRMAGMLAPGFPAVLRSL